MRIATTLMIGALLAGPALAQQPAPAAQQSAPAASYPEWNALTPQQREALTGPVRSRWNDNPAMREEMFKRAQRWQRMTPEQRGAAQRGMRRWEGLSPDQRKAMRDQWRSMSPEQRKAWVEANVPARAAGGSKKTQPLRGQRRR